MHHPYAHYYPHHWRFGRSPSRFVWFAIGAVAATCFHRFRDGSHAHRYLYHNHGDPVQDRHGLIPPADPAAAHAYPQYPASSQYKSPLWSPPNPMDERTWEERNSRMREFRQRAQETVRRPLSFNPPLHLVLYCN
jgi:hypothetical protein